MSTIILIYSFLVLLNSNLIHCQSKSFEEIIDDVAESNGEERKYDFLLKNVLKSECGTLLNSSIISQLGDLSVLVFGNMEHPTTLMVSMERRVDGFFYMLMNDICNEEDNDIKEILSHSTILFLMPTKQLEQHNCDEYVNVSTEERNIYELHKLFRFDFVMMYGTGGVKLRYLQQNNGMAETLMRRYQMTHPSMGLYNTDVCAGYNLLSRRGTNGLLVKQLQWSSFIQNSKDVFVRQLNGLLVLIACCYEDINIRYAYLENRQSIIETLKLRTTGLHFESGDSTLVLNDRGYPAMRVPADTTTFIALPEGETRIKVFHTGSAHRLITEFSMNLNETHRFERRRISKESRSTDFSNDSSELLQVR